MRRPRSKDGEGARPDDLAVAASAGGSGHSVTDRALWHPWFRVQRLIRAILETSADREARPVMQTTLVEALKEREKIRRAGWWN